jgi:hypothetical protein
LLEARTLASGDDGHDAGASGLAGFGLEVARADIIGGGTLELRPGQRMGQEDDRLDERDLQASKSPLAGEKALQPLALAVREEDRVVLGVSLAFVFPSPARLVALDNPWSALDLNEEGTLGADHERVQLVDRAVISDELEKRPGEVVVLGRKSFEDKIQGLPLPREARFANRLPVLFRHTPSIDPDRMVDRRPPAGCSEQGL